MISMKRIPLSQLATVSAGQSAPKDNEFSDSGIPFVRAGSLKALISGKNESEMELVSPETANLRKLKVYPKGTILFAKSGMSATKDRVYVLQNPAHVVSHLAILIPKESIDVDYLRLALTRFPPSSLIKDLAYPAISLSEIEHFEIPVPENFDDQIRVAHLLGKVEVLITQRKQCLQQLDDLLQSVFLNMFGDPVHNEKGWKIDSLSAYGSFKNGLNFGKGESGVRVRYLGVGDFKSHSALENFDSLTFIELNELPSKEYFLEDGDLLFVRSNGNGELVGRCMAVYPGAEKVTYSGFCIRYRLADVSLQATYLAHLFRSIAFRRIIFQGGQGANIQNINQKILSGLPIPIPDEDLQSQFAAIVEKVKVLKYRYQQNLTELERLYGTLSQQAFKGELDLSRLPMPSSHSQYATSTFQGNQTAVSEPDLQTISAIHLPDADSSLAALENGEAYKALIAEWLEAYLAKLADTPFSVQKFMELAQSRLSELYPDNDFVLGTNDYEYIKTRVFEALAAGTMTQGFDDSGNCIELKAFIE